jgi:hypothetical protein
LPTRVTSDKVHPSNDARIATFTVSVEDLDSKELGFLGNAVGSRANGSRNVSSVALAV